LFVEARDQRREFQRIFRRIVRPVLQAIRFGPIVFESLSMQRPPSFEQRSAETLGGLGGCIPGQQIAARSGRQQRVRHAIGAHGGFAGHAIVGGQRRFRMVESPLQAGDAQPVFGTRGGLFGQWTQGFDGALVALLAELQLIGGLER